jgi:hypothetical protein
MDWTDNEFQRERQKTSQAVCIALARSKRTDNYSPQPPELIHMDSWALARFRKGYLPESELQTSRARRGCLRQGRGRNHSGLVRRTDWLPLEEEHRGLQVAPRTDLRTGPIEGRRMDRQHKDLQWRRVVASQMGLHWLVLHRGFAAVVAFRTDLPQFEAVHKDSLQPVVHTPGVLHRTDYQPWAPARRD